MYMWLASMQAGGPSPKGVRGASAGGGGGGGVSTGHAANRRLQFMVRFSRFALHSHAHRSAARVKHNRKPKEHQSAAHQAAGHVQGRTEGLQ